ncbi:MAG TPA: hypothetical protein VIM07_13835 [Chitinophagaceae bacterium]
MKIKTKILHRIIFFVIIFAGFVVDANAQTVTANLLITPPYSVYFRDYAGYGRTNNMLLSLFSTTNRRVYLAGSVTKDDNSVIISVKNAYRPLAPILLTANTPLMLNGLQLRKIYGNGTTDDLNLTGLTANDIGLNQALPEGSYTFCIQVKDFDTREILSTACKTIFVTYYDPPQIINPFNGSAVQGFSPQMLMVTWQNTAPQVFGITYRLKIVKLINGVTPLDALNNNVQLILDKGNLFTTNYPLDVSSGIKLDPGQAYAMQVIAQSSTAYFKNNGKSEVTTFYYKGQNNFADNKLELDFLNPVAYKGRDTVEVNNDKPFLLTWNLFEGSLSKSDTIFVSDTLNKKYGVVKYVVKITPALNPSSQKPVDKNFTYQTSVMPDVNNVLHSTIKYDEENADKAGLKENYWYNATVSAYDKNDQLVVQNSSADFLYKKTKDDEVYVNTSVHAVIKYSFKGFSEQYNAANTPVQVEALQKVKVVTGKPIIKIGNTDYYSFAKASASTQKNGEVNVVVNIPVSTLNSDSIYYRVRLDGAYYIDRDFTLLSAAPPVKTKITNNDTNYISFGQLVAKTYGYSLKVNVSKAFTSYRISSTNGALDIKLADNPFGADYKSTDSGMIYKVGFSKAAAGITMVLYRKTKKTYVPPVEGNLKQTDDAEYGDVEVARGITTIASDGKGHDTSFVKFDKLLSNIFNGDEYYLVALNPVTTVAKSIATNSSIKTGGVTAFAHVNPYFNYVYKDSGYVATEAVFKLPKPLNIDKEDSLYRNVSYNYEITSTKPPTSLIKGRILYQWKTDNTHQILPLARSTFKVVVDYLVNGKSIGYTTKFDQKTYEEKFFVPDGSKESAEGMQLLDFGKTMATGTTDAQGNFEIDVVNLNQKGSLGQGYVVSKGWSIKDEKQLTTGIKGIPSVINTKVATVFDPGNNANSIFGNSSLGGVSAIQQSVTQTITEQSFLNQGMSITMDNTGAFNISALGSGVLSSAKLQSGGQIISHGPNADLQDEEDKNFDDQLVSFQRVYRIVPDNPYIYPSKETAIVQPFEAITGNTFNSLVKEVKVKVSTRNNYGILDEMMVTVFRSLGDKTNDLPAGEGDRKYLQKTLVNPQYTGNTSDVQNAALLDKNNIFNTKFEYLWPSAPVNANGDAGFTTLLAGYNNYYIQAFSNPDQAGKYYKATFQAFNTSINDNNPDLWDGTISPDPINVTVTLQPLVSRAFLRLVDNATKSSIPYGKVSVYNPAPLGFGAISKTVLADNDGYAEIKVSDDPLKTYVTKDGTTISFSGYATGYKPSGIVKSTFNLLGQQFVYRFSLDPAGNIAGHLVSADEKVKGYIKGSSGQFAVEFNYVYKNVEAYIKTASGKVYTTLNGYFNIPAPAIAGNKIEIIPKDVAYFDTAYTMNAADAVKKSVDLKDISIYRRKHRIHFIVTDADNGSLVDNAAIQLENISVNTQKGIADFLFENVSVNNYTFIIHGPDGKNYIPITKNVKNEESKNFVTINIAIEKGSEISGKVVLDGSPVKNARVYIDADTKSQPVSSITKATGSITNDANLLQAFTDDAGNYTLHGVPVNNQNIDVLATLDTSFAVNGDREKAAIINKKAVTNFSLTGYRDLVINNLNGFPLTVEKITPTANADEVKVSGLVHWSQSVSNFSLNEINEVIRVEDVLYRSVATAKGKTGVAQDDVVTLQGTSDLKLKYLDKYNVQLIGPVTSIVDLFTPKPLTISKQDDYGVIKGMIKIVDNSFNYPSSYLNFKNEDFWFAQKNNGAITTTLSAVKSAIKISDASSGNYNTLTALDKQVAQAKATYTLANSGTTPDYYLSNFSGGNLQFSFIEFNANADAQNSFIDKLGKIHLNISMNCHIKNAQPENFSVKLNDVVLDENKVYPATNTTPIEVALEAWQLSIKNWSISSEQGGIISNDGLIKTAKLDIPFSTFVLRSDMFDIDNFKVNDLKIGGGIVALSDINAAGAGLVFDNKTGSDMMPHWRFTLSGTGAPVATIKNLPGINGVIGINYIQVLSNNENIFQLQQTSTTLLVNNNPMAKFSPQIIANGPDYFNITGGLNINAPRMSDMSLELNYSLQNGVLAMKLRNVKTEFEGKGFIHFTAVEQGSDQSNITINPGQVIITGEVEEKPNRSFNPVPAIFTASTGAVPGYKVVLQKDYVMQLTSETKGSSSSGYKLTIAKGGMEVSGGDWGTLSYEGIMASNSTADKGVKDTYTKFNVLGDVSVSADKVEMENATPFGKLTMIFDFPAKRLIGKLDLDHVQLGTNTITGTVETLFDPAGFFVAGGGSADINIGNPIADGTYNLGFMIGSYPLRSANDDLWKIVTAYKQPEVKNDCFVQKLDGKLAGFYMSVDRMIFDMDYDFDFVIVSGYVNGKALVGVDMWANFSGATSLGVAVKVYAHAAAGMSAITGTSISGSITALAALKLAYEYNKFVVQGSIDMSFAVSIHQELLVTSVSASASVGCSAQGGTEGFSFKLTSGGPVNACY